MSGFVDRVGYQKLSIDVKELSAEQLRAKYDYLEEHYDEFAQLLRTRNPQLTMESRRTNELLVSTLGSS